jgi:hypothetical protein
LWQHYCLYALVPIIGLFRSENRWDFATVCVLLSFIAFSAPLLWALGFQAGEKFGPFYPVLFFSWMPLIPAVLAHVASERRRLEAAGVPTIPA